MIHVDAAVRQMLEMPHDDRRAARDAIIMSVLPAIGFSSKKWCRDNADPWYTQLADVEGEAALIVTKLIGTIAKRRTPSKVRDWDAYLKSALDGSVRRWFKSSAVTGFAELEPTERRLAHTAWIVEGLREELMREPTVGEALAAQHANRWAREKDPKRHGSLASVDEVRSVLARAIAA
ncbi:hypothetical protein SAMN05216368_1097 [Cryobacterium flavum]|uniref:Uncharacterized protein n=1 Tax=Cryobacterium flavum TaxID=1424659 RepID=A0A4R8V4T4_9MICO|nr:hypothetical protein [Cryobacterium flavum]TFB76115.1 hypothetical protein E3O21_11715 [Cryobacterium flavum]SDN99931.1 hypothetical protein SAMN05216368_1097 [Cryobacterium flavum]